jgi:hypothetical protein
MDNLEYRKQILKIILIFLGCFTFAFLACEPGGPPNQIFNSVTALDFKDGNVYAAEVYDKGFDDYPAAWSTDGGYSWNNYYSMLGDIAQTINDKTLPITACSSSNPESCYRVTEEGKLEQSDNKGFTWKDVSSIDKYSISKAYDLLIFNWGEKEYLIVAVGENGILHRILPDGKWNLKGVLQANKK